MRFTNTSSAQDATIDSARNANTVTDLLDIIQDLDDRLTEETRKVSELTEKLADAQRTIKERERLDT
jgi:hypothetical protein